VNDSQKESRASPTKSSVSCCQQTIPFIESVESIFPFSGRLVGKPEVIRASHSVTISRLLASNRSIISGGFLVT